MQTLLIIDPQNDFCDLPAGANHPAPTLPVTGADADMCRLAEWIQTHSLKIDAITVTLDTHAFFDIAHPTFWWKVQAGHPQDVSPFTSITAEQMQEGFFIPRHPEHTAPALAYLQALEKRGRYTHMVWPVHCEVGTWGHNVHAHIQKALEQWELKRQRAAQRVFKGMDPWTEHYSAIEAEVPNPVNPHTQRNLVLLEQLAAADHLFIAGEASSHCVRATVEDLVTHLAQTSRGLQERVILLRDCMSPVTGFATQSQVFFENMQALGCQVLSAQQATAWLTA